MSGFRSLCNRMRRRFPGVKVRVERRSTPDDRLAESWHDDDTFIIRIDKDIDDAFAQFLLPHEWAHAVSWHVDQWEHGPAFWKAYKQTYRVYTDWCKEPVRVTRKGIRARDGKSQQG